MNSADYTDIARTTNRNGAAFRKFMGINFLEEQAPDATTLLHFRWMMGKSKIGEQLFRVIHYVIE